MPEKTLQRLEILPAQTRDSEVRRAPSSSYAPEISVKFYFYCGEKSHEPLKCLVISADHICRGIVKDAHELSKNNRITMNRTKST